MERTGTVDPVSYTHLDVYKRQADVNVANLSTGSFPVTMSGNTAVTVSEQYLANQAGEPVETAIPAGTAVNKAADAAIAGSEAFPFTDINAYTCLLYTSAFLQKLRIIP